MQRNITTIAILLVVAIILYILFQYTNISSEALAPPEGLVAVQPMQGGPSLRPLMVGGGYNPPDGEDNMFILPQQPAPVPAMVFRSMPPFTFPPVGETARQVAVLEDPRSNKGFLQESVEANASLVGDVYVTSG